MADSVGAGPSGSSGVLSSTMRSITRMNGEPHDKEVRRVEDVVDLSPRAVDAQATDRPVEPADSSDTLRNPGAYRQEQELREAEAEAAEVREAETDPVTLERPVSMGLAAAIALELPEMVQRFDVNGDDDLDQRERDRAIRSVQSDSSFAQVRGGAAQHPNGDAPEPTTDVGKEAYAELQVDKAEAEARYAEEKAKAERARAERLAELDEQGEAQGQAATPRSGGVDTAYARSEELGGTPSGRRSVSA